MRKLLLLFLALAICTPGSSLRAQQDPTEAQLAQEAIEEASEELADWEKAIDDAFGVALEWGNFVPFFNLLWFNEKTEEELAAGVESGEIPLGPTGQPVQTALPFVVLWLVIAAIILTLGMRFVNLRMFGHAIQVVRGRYDNPD
ncbi:MAG: hypothetical protein ACYTG5_20970, partial [Planctomycetota bacterium]